MDAFVTWLLAGGWRDNGGYAHFWRPGKSGYVYDSRGDVESRFTRDFLLTVATLYWATATITSSMRDYYDNRRWQGEPRLGPADLVRVPTAVAVFPHMLIPEGEPPREWAERLYDVHRWTVMPRGGHFASAEEPDLVARDVGDRSGGEAVHQGPERAAP